MEIYRSEILDEFFKPYENMTNEEKIRYLETENKMLKESLVEADKKIILLSKGDVSGSLSFDESVSKNMTFAEIIRFWKPNATDEEVEKIFGEMYNMAYKDAVEGRRNEVTHQMIFDRIKYTYFKKINCH